jgi:CARDB
MASEFKPEALLAQREFDLIQDLLRTPLREDLSGKVLFERRRWIGGCLLAVNRPDLIPFNPRVDPSNVEELLVNVKNQGNMPVSRFTTTVTFNPRETDRRMTVEYVYEPPEPALEPDNFRVLRIPITFTDIDTSDKGCEFEVFVDSKSEVAESNEDNNKITGSCNCCGTGKIVVK